MGGGQVVADYHSQSSPDYAVFYIDEKKIVESTENYIIVFCKGQTESNTLLRLYSLQKKIKFIAKSQIVGEIEEKYKVVDQTILVFNKSGEVIAKFTPDCKDEEIRKFMNKPKFALHGSELKIAPVDFKFFSK